MTFPIPTEPVHVDVPDIYEAVGRFLLKYAVPAVSQDCIIKGFQNRIALPKTNELIIMTMLNHTRHGTNVYEFDARMIPHDQDGAEVTKELIEVEVQCDFYSDSDNGRRRATAVEMIARSPYAVQFFKQYGISCLYADDVRDMSGVMDSDQYVYRHMVTLHLSYTAVVSQKLPWFDAVNVDLKNVDVKFPPTESRNKE